MMNHRPLFLAAIGFPLDVRFCFRFSPTNAHTKRFSRWSATSRSSRFRAILVCAAMSSKPLLSRSKWPLILAIMSRSKPSRLRVSSASFLLSRKVVRPTIVSTVNPSKLLCIDGNVTFPRNTSKYISRPVIASSSDFKKRKWIKMDLMMLLVDKKDKIVGHDYFI